MTTILETILTGLSSILGTEVIIFLMFSFSFLAFLLSRGLGITSLISTFVLLGYLLSQQTGDTIPYLQYDYFILIIIILGLFMGLLIYNYFIKD